MWNSIVTRICGASRARHILVLADSCYGGALLRGEAAPPVKAGLDWYRRALTTPSRYVISSGGMEPVSDAGVRHSVFAEELLAFIGQGDRRVFSASDLGAAVKQKVSAVTGQMVQSGPLVGGGHAGGEFVFLRGAPPADLARPEPPRAMAVASRDDASPTVPARSGEQAVLEALSLARQGATNASQRLLNSLLAAAPGDRLATAVGAYLDAQTRQRDRDALHRLIERVETRAAAAGKPAEDEGFAKPRVIACLGPDPIGAATGMDDAALLYRIALRAELQRTGRVFVVEREALDAVMQEMELGTSNLANPQAKTAIGKLLPASLLLVGDLLPSRDGERLYLRLVDTETGLVINSFSQSRGPDEDRLTVCERAAADVAARAAAARPLTARVLGVEGNQLQAAVGTFHGVAADASFGIVLRRPVSAGGAEDYREEILGTGRVVRAGETTSELQVQWQQPPDRSARSRLWVQERAP